MRILALAFSHLASTTFCWLPPERLRQSVLMLGVRTCSRSTQLVRQPPLLARVDQAVPGQAAEIGERDVGGDRQEQHQPFDAPLARDVADADVDRLGGRREAHLAAADARGVPPSCGAKPASVRVSSSRPEPMTPAMPRISPACSLKLTSR